MSFLERVHERWIFRRRVEGLTHAFGAALRPCALRTLLDVGCGDGRITRGVTSLLPGVESEGIDVLVRSQTLVPVRAFDGRRLPYPDGAFDAVMAVDVLHHADDPAALLAEMARVSRRWVALKDHFRDGWLADSTLRFMDDIGNRRHGVRLPYHYLARREWDRHFAALGLRRVRETGLPGLYPWPLRLVFGRKLHFLAVLEKSPPVPAAGT